MQRFHKMNGIVLGLAIALAVATGAADAQTPCIDARPIGLTGATLTFFAGDGRSVTRTGAVLRNFDPMSNVLNIDDGGETRRLNLNEWPRVLIGLEEPQQQAQMATPMRTPILSLSRQQYKLSTMKVVDGLVFFGDCQNPSGPGEIRFGGELKFDAKTDALVVSGTFWQYVMSGGGGPSINPGTGKGGIP